VPATAYALLGLLSFAEMSGYDLQKMVEQSVAYFFSPAKSHIYAELRRLVSLGWASERTVRQQDRPDKRMYRITKKGEQALRRWLESPTDEPEVFKSPALLRLFFGHMASVETLRAQMKDYRAQAQARMDEYKALEKTLEGQEAALFPYLTLRCGIVHTRASIRWADEVLKELEKR
jgi:DNA-binding PadR family transcriptional regulator